MRKFAYLTEKGIKTKRLRYKGYGETDQIAPNEKLDNSVNPEGRALNRRVEFEMVD